MNDLLRDLVDSQYLPIVLIGTAIWIFVTVEVLTMYYAHGEVSNCFESMINDLVKTGEFTKSEAKDFVTQYGSCDDRPKTNETGKGLLDKLLDTKIEIPFNVTVELK